MTNALGPKPSSGDPSEVDGAMEEAAFAAASTHAPLHSTEKKNPDGKIIIDIDLQQFKVRRASRLHASAQISQRECGYSRGAHSLNL